MSLQDNIKFAKYGIQRIEQRMPFGGLNRKDIHDTFMQDAPNIYKDQLALLINIRAAYKKNDIFLISTILNHLYGGFCGDLAEITKFEIKTMFPDAKVEKVKLTFHSLLVIGRKEESDRENMATWGDDAVMCDPWAKKIYLVKNWSIMQKKDPIPFFRMRSGQLEEINEHYLTGTPKIE